MKTKFTTLDLMASITDLQSYLGMRVQNVYDIDNKTYLLKLNKTDHKAVILLESGIRMHSTEFDWTKSPMPNGFSMKLRKHIKQKRLDSVKQIGVDRIVDLQFGDEVRACHVIIELYDRGNVVLTDHEYNILNLLRWRSDKDTDVRFAVGQKYPCELARQTVERPTDEQITGWFDKAKVGDNFRRVLVPNTLYSAPLIEHAAHLQGLSESSRYGHEIKLPDDMDRIRAVLDYAHGVFEQFRSASIQPDQSTAGVITLKMESKLNKDSNELEPFESYQEFHPMLFEQHKSFNDSSNFRLKHFPSFCAAVDEFFSARETQKLDLKVMQQQKQVEKKLENIKNDHETRLNALKAQQDEDNAKAALIELNCEFVDKAIIVLRSAVANQLSWTQIQELINEAALRGDPVASSIKKLKLDVGLFTMRLTDPYADVNGESSSQNNKDGALLVDIDIQLGAFQNARQYYEHRRAAATKESKTLEASSKAIKSAEVKAQEQMKQVHVKAAVTKQRKTYWFEKFLWFISSDNYLVVGGRDAQQNELLVKKFLLAGDAYVHADLRGAASVVIKNVKGATAAEIPPRTMNEAANMAVCHSAAWDAKVVAGAWWVTHEQVSRTAPSGEYLSAGSFMIRGKKNYLPTVQLVMGFSFLFRLDDDFIEHHKGERRPIKTNQDDELDDKVEPDNAEDEDEEVQLSEDDQQNDESENENAYPDVQLPVINPVLRQLGLTGSTDDQEEITILQLGPQRQPPQPLNRNNNANNATAKNAPNRSLDNNDKQQQQQQKQTAGQPQQQQAKRGQKHKLKKMKEKYADQDEEERQMRIEILAADGEAKPAKKHGKGKKNKGQQQQQQQQQQFNKTPASQPNTPRVPKPEPKEELQEAVESAESSVAETKPPVHNQQPEANKDDDNNDEEEQMPQSSEAAAVDDGDDDDKPEDDLQTMLDALTGRPLDSDTLLYAVPVCAPYSTLADYKFKVKLTPGTGKRGKATKMALQVFHKRATPLQRDLIKAANDQELARNLPGKVKVHAPQMQNVIQAQKKHKQMTKS